MNLTYKDNKLYMLVSPKERLSCMPYIYGAKLDQVTGLWVAPVGTLLPMLVVFPEIKPTNKLTRDLINQAKDILNAVQMQKNKIINKEQVTSKDYPFLMSHQVVCSNIAELRPRYAFFLDTGTGKTISSLAIMDRIINTKCIQWVVVCPKSIIKTAWLADSNEFFKDINLLPVRANTKKSELVEYARKLVTDGGVINKIEDLFPYVDGIVTNPEQFKKYYKEGKLSNFKGLIIDESTMIKNRQAQITDMLTKFAKECKHVYILSGKPAPNTPLDYFNQVKVVHPYIFGQSFTKFRDNFFKQMDYMGYDWALKSDKKELFTKLLDLCSIFVSKTDCLDLPPKTYLIREVELDKETMKHYKSMELQQLVCLKDADIPAPNKLASLMKLRQISSGFIIDTENATTTRLDKAKIQELATVLEELGDEKAIIWINFKEEVKAIEELMQAKGYTYVTAYQGTKNVDDSIEAFKNNTAQFIIAHPKTLKYGVTFTGNSMVKNCTYAIYYSLSYSFEDYYQSHDRIYRKGQTEPCTFIFLLGKDTIDYNLYRCINNKGTSAQLIEDMAKELNNKYEKESSTV